MVYRTCTYRITQNKELKKVNILFMDRMFITLCLVEMLLQQHYIKLWIRNQFSMRLEYGYRGAKPENISLKKIKIISECFVYKSMKLKD